MILTTHLWYWGSFISAFGLPCRLRVVHQRNMYRGSAARPRGAEAELSGKLRDGQDTPGGTAKTGARYHGPLEMDMEFLRDGWWMLMTLIDFEPMGPWGYYRISLHDILVCVDLPRCSDVANSSVPASDVASNAAWYVFEIQCLSLLLNLLITCLVDWIRLFTSHGWFPSCFYSSVYHCLPSGKLT